MRLIFSGKSFGCPVDGYLFNELKFYLNMLTNPNQNKETLIKLANYRMPFGRYTDRLLLEIPESYFIWFSYQGFPEGELGEFMVMMQEIKTNGLEYLLSPLQKKKGPGK